MYLRHVWQSDYYQLEDEDVKILKERGVFKERHDATEPLVDGWTKFVTGYIMYDGGLNRTDREFVNRKYKNKEKAVLQVTAPPENYKNDWQINRDLVIGEN